MYLEVIGTVSASDFCGPLGSPVTNPFIPVPSGALSTFEPRSFSVGEVFRPNFAPGQIFYGHHAKSLNVADLDCPSFGLGKTTEQDGQVHTTVGPPWLPLILPPPEVLDLDATWKASCPGLLSHRWGLKSFAIYDPPHVLEPGDDLMADPAVSHPAIPMSTASDAHASTQKQPHRPGQKVKAAGPIQTEMPNRDPPKSSKPNSKVSGGDLQAENEQQVVPQDEREPVLTPPVEQGSTLEDAGGGTQQGSSLKDAEGRPKQSFSLEDPGGRPEQGSGFDPAVADDPIHGESIYSEKKDFRNSLVPDLTPHVGQGPSLENAVGRPAEGASPKSAGGRPEQGSSLENAGWRPEQGSSIENAGGRSEEGFPLEDTVERLEAGSSPKDADGRPEHSSSLKDAGGRPKQGSSPEEHAAGRPEQSFSLENAGGTLEQESGLDHPAVADDQVHDEYIHSDGEAFQNSIVPGYTQPPNLLPPPITVGDETFAPAASGFNVGNFKIRPGGPAATVAGTQISMGPSGRLLIGSHTFLLTDAPRNSVMIANSVPKSDRLDSTIDRSDDVSSESGVPRPTAQATLTTDGMIGPGGSLVTSPMQKTNNNTKGTDVQAESINNTKALTGGSTVIHLSCHALIAAVALCLLRVQV